VGNLHCSKNASTCSTPQDLTSPHFLTYASGSVLRTIVSITRAEGVRGSPLRCPEWQPSSLSRHDFTCCESGVSILTLNQVLKSAIKSSSEAPGSCVTLKFDRRSSKEVRENVQDRRTISSCDPGKHFNIHATRCGNQWLQGCRTKCNTKTSFNPRLTYCTITKWLQGCRTTKVASRL